MKININDEAERYIQVKADFDSFAKVPYAIAEKKRVTGNAVKLFIIYFYYTNWRGSGSKRMRRIRQNEIAERLGYSVTTVSKLTSELHNKGWVTVKRTGRSNIITLHGKPKKRRKEAASGHKKQA